MKKHNIFFTVLVCMLILTGCKKMQDEIVQDSVNVGLENKTEVKIENENTLSSLEEFSFLEFKNLNFTFLSGAGGWSTEMTIAEDGSFSGIYHDSDMGSASESYPNGTQYYCSFHGKFAEPVRKDEYTYVTIIENISYDNPVGTEEIKNGIRYIYSDAYGLDSPEEILIYLPGMPINELPEGYLSWVRNNWRMDYEFTLNNDTLPFYGLYNVSEDQGFSSYDIIDDLEQSLEYREEEAATLEDSITQDPNLTQMDLNEKSYQLYQLWDVTLNEIWKILKRNLNMEDMAVLTEEQLDWIVMKEQSMKEAGTEVEGGSMHSMVIYQRGAKLTKERVYELLEVVSEIREY